MRTHILFTAGALLLSSLGQAQDYKLGGKAGDFVVSDLKGAPAHFSALKGDVTVVMFISAKCPISNNYSERMKALYNQYSPKGVKFVFLNANQNEPPAEVEQHAREHGYPFPIYKDANNVVADLFGAQVTPEAFIIDSQGVIRLPRLHRRFSEPGADTRRGYPQSD